ncbi:2-dehydro-3-deoxyphosphooctonate aldolase [Flavobacterium sp.]|jgi:hypothetical protein|uniref:2-dehydro-3-deoxyphosphooctonate aldolase n=1 Tax=Flavobacterium sp. TaxID=239 RepID=UPI002A8310AE|nr:2-dehydro-3-deoxyphosphooctonate aldolase [Flavobacterium sp.]
MKRYLILLLVATLTSCVSTKSTIQNIDNTAVKPMVKNDKFLFTEYATDGKYGFDADYPINIGLILEKQEQQYIGYFFNGLESKNGEKINFKKVDTCCPFPTKNNTMGAGTLSIYEYTFEGTNKKGLLYFNILEKGKILCPKGFAIKNK